MILFAKKFVDLIDHNADQEVIQSKLDQLLDFNELKVVKSFRSVSGPVKVTSIFNVFKFTNFSIELS